MQNVFNMQMTAMQRLLIAVNLSVTAMSILKGYYKYMGDHPNQQAAAIACPNADFVRRHLCEFCSSEKDAFDFSRRRSTADDPKATNVNGVVFGYPGFVRSVDGSSCVNEKPVKVMACTMKTGGKCMNFGERCLVQHSLETGQLDFGNITCS